MRVIDRRGRRRGLRCCASSLVSLLACEPDPDPLDLGNDSAMATTGGESDLPAPAGQGEMADIQVFEGIEAADLSIATDGSMYVAGLMRAVATDLEPTRWLARFSADGALLWSEQPPGLGTAVAVSATSDGFLYYHSNPQPGGEDPHVERRTVDGEILWTIERSQIVDFTAAPDGGAVIFEHKWDGARIRKFDAGGAEEWTTLVEPPEEAKDWAVVRSAQVADDGTIWATHVFERNDDVTTPIQMTLLALRADGTIAFEIPFGTSSDEFPTLKLVDGAAVAMLRGPEGAAWSFADDGVVRWTYSDDIVTSWSTFAPLADGGFVVAGSQVPSAEDPQTCDAGSHCPHGVALRRVDGERQTVWDASTDACNWVRDVELAPNGDVVVLATCIDTVTFATSMALMRFGA